MYFHDSFKNNAGSKTLLCVRSNKQFFSGRRFMNKLSEEKKKAATPFWSVSLPCTAVATVDSWRICWCLWCHGDVRDVTNSRIPVIFHSTIGKGSTRQPPSQDNLLSCKIQSVSTEMFALLCLKNLWRRLEMTCTSEKLVQVYWK